MGRVGVLLRPGVQFTFAVIARRIQIGYFCRAGIGTDSFLWLNVPLSSKIRDRINHVPHQPAVPVGQTSIRQHVSPQARPLVGNRPQYPSPRIGRSVPDEFEMCDNGYNTLSAPFIFEGLRYREWMKDVWRQFCLANAVLRDDPTDERLKQERERVLREAWGRYEQDEGRHPETARVLNELYRRILLGQTVPRVVGWFTEEERRALNAQLPAKVMHLLRRPSSNAWSIRNSLDFAVFYFDQQVYIV